MAVPEIVLCKEDEIFLYSSGAEKPKPLSLKSLEGLKPGYILLIPDSLITLIETNIEPQKKRRLNQMVRLYLEGLAPDEQIKEDDFCYLMTSPVIACLYTRRFKESAKRLKTLFEKASLITTPSAVAVTAMKGTFFLKTEKTCLIKDAQGFIHIQGDVEGYDGEALENIIDLNEEGYQRIVEMVVGLYKGGTLKRINIKKALTGEKRGVLSTVKWDLVIWSVLYLLFVSALILRVMPVKREMAVYEKEIEEVYKKAGLQGESDPYGMLLFKVKKLKDSMTVGAEPLKIMLKVTEAFSERATVESLSLGREYLRIKGKAESLEALDRAIGMLKKGLKMDFKTESAKVEKEGVSFSIAGRIKS